MFDEPSQRQMLTVDGRSVGVRFLPGTAESAGSLPIILLHGLGCSADAWRPTLSVLAERRVGAVYVPDMPGFGCSPGPKKALSIAALADWLARVMDALGLEKANFAGNSLGGQVLLAFARRHPERLERLVLIGSTVGGQYISLGRYAAGLVLDGSQEPPIYTAVLTRMYAQMGLVRYAQTTLAMIADEPLEQTSGIKAPCLVLRGDRDGIIPDSLARRLAASLPNGQFRRLSGTAHAMQFTRPREFAEIALSFWAGRVEESAA
jgi:pimeloyl-ACP methyl ester carboxylesterase